MKSFFISILFTGMLWGAHAQDPGYPPAPATLQNIIAAETFIDTDPGIGLATAVPVTAGLNISNAAATINLTGLSNGIHHLYLRTKNAEGKWSITATKDFLYDFNPVYQTNTAAQHIIAAEYFIDTDPGIGAATPIALTAAVNISDVPVAVNTASLTNGVHRLYIRTKSAEGRWSLVNIKDFIVDFDFAYPAPPAAVQNIVAAEYFINTDPGPGNGTAIPITAATDISNIAVAVNTSSLSPATTNHLFIRTKNAAGHWSIANEKTFVVAITNDPAYPAAPAAVQHIIAAEYFIDTDPGPGNGTGISITAATDINNLATVINTSTLQPATTHQLFIRTKNAEGYWSIANTKQFVVSITNDPAYPAAPAAVQNIVAAEYFIDTDPGIGAATGIPVTAATNISNLAAIISTNGLSNGLHHFYLRTKNAAGSWSISNHASFYTDLLSVSPDSLLYGNVPTNSTVTKDLVITNNSAATQTITGVTIAAPYTTDFSAAIAIPAGQKDTIKVSFNPTATGEFIQGLQLQTTAGNYNTGLRGTGVAQVPSWALNPATGHNYGNVTVSSSASFSFTIQNTGNVPVTLSNVTTGNAAFVATFTAGTIIPVNGSISLPVAFNPAAVNVYTGQLRIESSTPSVGFVTTTLEGAGYNPGAPPVLQFVAAAPYNGTTGVDPVAGNTGDYTYRILYKSPNNRAPQTGFPKVSVDLNGNQAFTDLNEGTFTMTKETPGNDYATGVVYSYTYTHLNNTANAGYKFSATDDNGNIATSINTGYVSGPLVTDEQVDLRIFANDITFSQNNPAIGANFTVFAKVTNSTAVPVTNVPVKFYRDTIFIGSDVIPAVNAFSSATISRTMSFAAEGFYPIKVWIDSSNTLGDLNPLNNYAIRPVIVGSPDLPGSIEVTTNAVMQQCPQVKVLITGRAEYRGFGNDLAVAGAEVTINTGTQTITTTTNSNGDFSYLLTGVTCGGSFTYNVSVTDFTFTSPLKTNAIALPCPGPNACTPPPSMGGMVATANSNPCANIVGGTGAVSIRLRYRERNLANFWCAWDEIKKDTLRIFQDGVLIQTIGSADYSHSPGEEVIVPINVPLNSTTPTVISATLSYVYVEYTQIPSSLYHGNNIAMSHSGSVTISPVAAQPDLTIQGFAQTSFTSFRFDNANIKCVNAGAHTVKIYDSIPGGGAPVLISTRNITSLAAGTATGITYSDPNITSGTHFIKVKTDADEGITETNEGNNEFVFRIEVPKSELFITKLTSSPTDLGIGSTTQFTATIKNTGRSAPAFTVRFTVNGTQVGALKNVAGLAENGTTTITSDAYTVTNNSFDCGETVVALADAGNQVDEQDNNNNDLSIKLGTDIAPYQKPGEVGSASNPAVVRVFTTNQFYPAIRNIGYRDAENVTVKFTLNNNRIGSDTVNYVKAGEIFASHTSFTRMFTVAGDYVVKVIADTANTICENLENNNEGDFHIRVVESKPDLEVLSQYISPSSLNPNIGQAITLVGTVKNMGGNVSTPTVLRFLVDDVQLGADVPIDALLPGRDTTVAATTTYSSIIPGVKIMKIVADPANTMTEEREDNNVATRTMIVGDAPDMARSFAGAISFNPSGFVPGDSVTVHFTLKNQGVRDASTWVKFFIKDTTFNTTVAIDSMPVSLLIGETKTISKRMLFTIGEGHVTTQIYNTNPPESDMLNNDDTLRFTTIAKMKQAITINGNLDMKMGAPSQLPGWIGGKIMLGDNNLTVNGFILNYDSAHFIISNGTGKLKLVNGVADNIYPVGTSDSSMNFVRINNAGTQDNFSVRVAPYVLQNGNSGDTIQVAWVDRTWFIEEDVPGGSNATAEFWWSSSHELPGFSRPISRTAHYTSLWDLGPVGPATLNSNGQYSRSQSGFTSFSPFGVTSTTGPVPLTLLSFSAVNKPNSVALHWKTGNEINTASFDVERSENGIHFSSIGSRTAFNSAGTHTYSLDDMNPLNGTSYYRLKQIDTDGSFVYSDIIAINRNAAEDRFAVAPNPVADIAKVIFAASDKPRKLLITDGKGRLVQSLAVPAGSSMAEVNMTMLANGLYYFSLVSDKGIISGRVMKQ